MRIRLSGFRAPCRSDACWKIRPASIPVILCYKLNDQWLTPESGAPVRMVVPDAYGNKSVKWLQRIVLTNRFQSNDTYAEWNNDTESHAKTYARFCAGAESGVGQGGVPDHRRGAGRHVRAVARPGLVAARRRTPATDDPHFSQAPWQDAAILPPPEHWGGGLAGRAVARGAQPGGPG